MTRAITVAGYAVIAVAMAALQLASLLSNRIPTIGQATATVTRRRPGRYLLLATWLWVGWHLFVRSHVGS
jgi:hypothetical protein